MRLYLLGRAIIPICVILGTGCGSSQSASSETTATGSPAAGPGLSPSQTPGVASAQASPVPAASLQVSPTVVPIGNVSLTLAFEPARHMEDETRLMTISQQPQPPAPQPTLTLGPPSLGAIVLN